MNLGKIFNIFKKGAKATSGQKGKKGGGMEWPAGLRIGIYGHANSGKTVYFTVLNEECKIAKDLQISVIDNATAGEFLSNYRMIWGLASGATGGGTVVDMRGDKKFPEPTISDKILKFNAILDHKKRVSVVTYDYSGRSVSIRERTEQTDKVIDFMSGCHGLLFFYDPKTLAAEMQSQEHVASFVSMLERLMPLNKRRLPIPIALVVTKADILPGFKGEEQIVLIRAEDESFVSEDFELFLDKVLTSNNIAANTVWAGTVREILIRLKDFLKVVTGRTLDFQIFFTSNTGEAPEKIGTDVGRSLYAPPAKIRPIGIREPFYWILKSIMRSRKISRMRAVARFITFVSIVWIILYSLPNLYHFKFLLSGAYKTESSILQAYKGNIYNTSVEERRKIVRAYDDYSRSWTVKWLYQPFQAPAERIKNSYSSLNVEAAATNLNQVIKNFTAIVSDTSAWPKVNPSDTQLIENERHKKLVEEFNGFHQGDETSILYKRSDRALNLWDMFKRAVAAPNDTTVWVTIQKQVQLDKDMYGNQMSAEEIDLGKALSKYKAKQIQIVTAQKAATELTGLIQEINSNPNGAFRLDTAVTLLRQTLANLDPAVDKTNIAMINRYLQAVARWNKRQQFTAKIEVLPEKAHLHIEVTENGKAPLWEEHNQISEGKEVPIYWKVGDNIHIAIDLKKQKCKWGKESSDRVVLKDKYSLFQMDGEVSFDNVGKKAGISFKPPLVEQLPVLK